MIYHNSKQCLPKLNNTVLILLDYVTDYVEYLGELLGNWMTFPVVQRKRYIKICRKQEPKELLHKLESFIYVTIMFSIHYCNFNLINL